MKIRLLSHDDINAALPMAEAIDACEGAYRAVSMGETVMPQRVHMDTDRGPLLLMPVLMKAADVLAVKLVTVFPENAKTDLPVIHALVLVMDGQTGEPRALLNGVRLTALRTGAAAGVATKALARKNAQVMAIIGAGAQAADQIRAVLAVRPIQEVRIFDRVERNARNLAVRLGLEIEKVRVWAPNTLERTLKDADVVTTVTTSREPVFEPAMISSGTHINGVGAFTLEMKEVPAAGLPLERIFVDQRKAARAEAGDVVQALNEGRIKADNLIEIGSVLLGAEKGRRSDQEITFFKTVGLAAQDAATAQAILKKAETLGLGRMIEL
jgi:ornithine cyclodeaminase